MVKGKKTHLVHVTWVDSCLWHGWQSPSKAKRGVLVVCQTVGWLIAKTARHVNLVQSVNDQGDVSETWIIPRSCVRRIRRLR